MALTSSHNITADIQAADGGVAAGGSAILNVSLAKTRGPMLPPACVKEGYFWASARRNRSIAVSQMKRTEREFDRCRLLRTMHFRENGGNHG